MKILIAPDSFKESLDAKQVSLAIERGVKKVLPSSKIELIPMADGGEGSVQALVNHTKGNVVYVDICDPLLRPISASYGVLGDGETAVVESASAIGLSLLTKEERNPFITSSYGVGLMIHHAIESGYGKIVVCIGGTSTNDGGLGLLQALGCELLDGNGECLGVGNQALANLSRIDTSKMNDLLDGCELILASDVTNPLLGEEGASYVFAKQKGATDDELPVLDANLKHYADVVAQTVGKDYSTCFGAGAAGGIGFALMALTGAKMRKGVELMIELLEIERTIVDADLIFTGEGSVDSQTSFGKVVQGIASSAKKYDKPVVALCGRKVGDMADLHESGLTAVFSIADSPMSMQESMSNAELLIEKQAEEVMRLFLASTNMRKKL